MMAIANAVERDDYLRIALRSFSYESYERSDSFMQRDRSSVVLYDPQLGRVANDR